MYKALLEEYKNDQNPDFQVLGCNFHQKKGNLHYGFTELGLKKLFSENPILNKQYKRFLNTRYLPKALIPVAFDFITTDLLPILRRLANYFQDNYIGRNGAPGRFPMSFWNIYERYTEFLYSRLCYHLTRIVQGCT